MQVPVEQRKPLGHWFPHLPAGARRGWGRSQGMIGGSGGRHSPPFAFVGPVLQATVPLRHLNPVSQPAVASMRSQPATMSQPPDPPQLAGSTEVKTQPLGQQVWPVTQETEQTLQWAGLVGSTHWPLQRMKPAAASVAGDGAGR